jgi:hypothetical protein
MLIRVKVFPKSKKDEIIKKRENSFEVRVREKAEQGRANEKVLEILSEFFGIEKNKFRLVKGGKERSKIFEVLENK